MMLEKITLIKNNRFAQNSFVVFIGSFLGGAGGYVYNMLMGRMLGPADYGELSSLISLFYIVSVASSTLSIIVSRSISEFKAQNNLEEGSCFISRMNRLLLKASFLIFVLFTFASPLAAEFLQISSSFPVIALGAVLGVSFVGAANTAGLQGLQRFFHLSLNSILYSLLKVVFGVLLVWAGFGVSGALGSLAFAGIITAYYAYIFLALPKKSKSASEVKINLYSAISHIAPVFLATLCLTAFYNIDVVLVKHFFTAENAGYYSALSLIGRIIFFITGSVAVVLFPVVVERNSRKEKYSHVVRYSIFLILAVSLAITFLYFIIPHFIVKMLFGSLYLPVAPYLGYFGLIMTFFSLINLFAVYNLSLKRASFIPFLALGLAIEVSLIYVFHESIWQVIEIMLVSAAITLFLLTALYFKADVKGKHRRHLK